jgi:two-component system KDP operon response regulator KdpE
MSRILVVDDEPQILRALGTNLKARGYQVDLAPTGEAALALAAPTSSSSISACREWTEPT